MNDRREEEGQREEQLALVPLDEQTHRALVQRAEIQASAMAAKATAEVQARYAMAAKFPRNMDVVRQELLADCKRIEFAEVAFYARPVGREKNEETGEWEDTIAEGPSIRFAEACVRCMKNMLPELDILFEDEQRIMFEVRVTDLERNNTRKAQRTLIKETEKTWLKKGEQAKRTRINSRGKTVYILDATPDEMRTRLAAEAAKMERTLTMKQVPTALQIEAIKTAKATLERKATEDPAAEMKKVTDAFFALNISVNDLEKLLKHPIKQTTPAETVRLRGVYNALKKGETTWNDILEQAGLEVDPAAAPRKMQATDEGGPVIDVPKKEPPPPPPPIDQAKPPSTPHEMKMAEYLELVEKLGKKPNDIFPINRRLHGTPNPMKLSVEQLEATMAELREGAAADEASPPTT